MANFTVRYFSNCLRRPTTFKMFIPNDVRNDFQGEENPYAKRPIKTLFLLHGYTGDAENWVPEELATKYNFAVVVPNGENSFWLDGCATGHQFCTFVGEELVNYVRKTFNLALTKEDTCIMGLSMGGFGALHTAFAYPDTFGKTTALSSALITHGVAEMEENQGNEVANYAYYKECFGEPKELLESENNPETQVKNLLSAGKALPEIFMAVGTEDFLLENNRALHKFFEDNNVNHVYIEDKGQHDMVFWSKYVQEFIPRMFG